MDIREEVRADAIAVELAASRRGSGSAGVAMFQFWLITSWVTYMADAARRSGFTVRYPALTVVIGKPGRIHKPSPTSSSARRYQRPGR